MSDLFKRDAVTGAFSPWLIALLFLMKRARLQKSAVVARESRAAASKNVEEFV